MCIARKYPMYVDQIKKLADECNEYLFAEGDISFITGDYLKAKERYVIASHGINEENNKRFAVYLREACVYCKLEQYGNASQAVLQALQHQHETDMSLTLNELLHELPDQTDEKMKGEGERDKLLSEIDKFVADIMNKLLRHTSFFETPSTSSP